MQFKPYDYDWVRSKPPTSIFILDGKVCKRCGQPFKPTSGIQKRCPTCMKAHFQEHLDKKKAARAAARAVALAGK
jgi:hypothetical protein